jgi:hypothetical protein
VGLFKKRFDRLSAVASLISAVADENQTAVAECRQALDPVSTMDVLYGLAQFGQVISPGITTEHRAVITEVLNAVDGSPDVQAAVRKMGWAVLVDGEEQALAKAANTYLEPLIPEPNNLIRNTVFDTVTAVGVICRRLDVKLNFN